MNKVGNLTREEAFEVLKDVSKFRKVELIKEIVKYRDFGSGVETFTLYMEDATLDCFDHYHKVQFPGNKVTNIHLSSPVPLGGLFGCIPTPYENINWILKDEAPEWFKEKYGRYEEEKGNELTLKKLHEIIEFSASAAPMEKAHIKNGELYLILDTLIKLEREVENLRDEHNTLLCEHQNLKEHTTQLEKGHRDYYVVHGSKTFC